MPALISVDTAARELGVIPRQVRALLAKGKLKGVQAVPGAAWMVYAGSVAAYGRHRRGPGRPPK